MKNSPAKPPTILWADDDPDDIGLMREVLALLDSHHHIIEASNGREALDILLHLKVSGDMPCLIVLDMNMPVLSGRETLVLLKQDPVFKEIPTIVFTTSKSPLDRVFCTQYSTEMLTKPLTMENLKEIMQNMLQLCDASMGDK